MTLKESYSIPKVLVICLDALVPGAINAETMPNLHRARSLGVLYTNHHAVAPSETMVNVASLVTGEKVSVHGIVANQFLDRSYGEWRLLNLAVAEDIDQWMRVHGSPIQVPTLGEHLAEAGRRLAIVSTASCGATRTIDPLGEALGHFSFACHTPDKSYPASQIADILDEFGPCPEKGETDVEAVRYAIDVLIGYVFPKLGADVGILWLNEPDTTYHQHGIRGTQAVRTLREIDVEIGRLLDLWQQYRREDCTLFLISDHGQVDLLPAADLNTDLQRVFGGSLNGRQITRDGLYLRASRCSLVYLSDDERVKLPDYVTALLGCSWIGEVFCKSHGSDFSIPAGAFDIETLMGQGGRVPDIAFMSRAAQPGDESEPVVLADLTEVLGGHHGGLHESELECLLLAIGPTHRPGTTHDGRTTIDQVFDAIMEAAGLGKSASAAAQTVDRRKITASP